MIYRAFMLAAVSTFAVAANANLVNNGSFEVGNYTGGGFQTLGANSSVITGWTANNIDWINTYWTAQAGTKSVDLNATSIGSIEQSFGTTAGVQYLVEFYLSGNNAGLPVTKSLQVTADATTYNDTFVTTGNSLTNMGWVKKSFTFTADDASATLKFASTNSGSFGPAIDNVTVQAVPEPASMAVISIGLLALKRRRSSK